MPLFQLLHSYALSTKYVCWTSLTIVKYIPEIFPELMQCTIDDRSWYIHVNKRIEIVN